MPRQKPPTPGFPASLPVVVLCLAAAILPIRAQQSAAQATEPAAPKPLPEVQELLDESKSFAQGGDNHAAQSKAEEALQLATEKADPVGEAMAHMARAEAFGRLQRHSGKVAAYEAAAAAWERAGDGPGQIEAWAEAGIQLLKDNHELGKARLERALSLARQESRRGLAAASALQRAGDRLWSEWKPEEAKMFFTAALAIRDELVPDSLAVAESAYSLGDLAWWSRQVGAPDNYFRRAYAIRLRLAPRSPEMAYSLRSLGVMAIDRGDYPEARQYHLQALEIFEALGPQFEVPRSYMLNNLGRVAWWQGDYAAAEEWIGRAVEIQERIAPGSISHGVFMGNLGDVALRRGNWDEAEQKYRASLSLLEKQPDAGFAIGQTLDALGQVFRAKGDLQNAREYYERAVTTIEKFPGTEASIAWTFQNLGQVAADQGDWQAAESSFRRALKIREKLYGQSHPFVARDLAGLAAVLVGKGDLLQALETATRAEQISRDHARLITRALTEREALLHASARASGLDVALTLVANQSEAAPAKEASE